MKNALSFLCAFILLCPNVFAEDISAECACVMVAETGEVVYSKNAEKEHAMASTTKIMTALLAIESGKGEELVTVSKNAERQEGSSLYLRCGEVISVSDLAYGLMLNSGNDAAVALAEFLGGNTADFAQQMTEKAKSIGAEHTQFQNPSGLDQDGHYTTAQDLAKITAYAMKNEEFCKIVSTRKKTITTPGGQIIYLKNHNKLLDQYEGALGVKTGYTKKTGRCLVSAAERDGILLIAVTLHAPNDWNDHKLLLDRAFADVSKKRILSAGQVLKEQNGITLAAAGNADIPEKNPGAFEIRLHLPKNPVPPINQGEKLGEAEILRNGVCVRTIDVISEQTLVQKTGNSFLNLFFLAVKYLIL